MTRFAYPRPYEQLDDKTRDAVDEAFTNAVATLRAAGLVCYMDDRAEHLVDAITEYVNDSREDNK